MAELIVAAAPPAAACIPTLRRRIPALTGFVAPAVGTVSRYRKYILQHDWS